MKPNVVIVSAKRSAIGSFNGSLSNIKATLIGTTVVKSILSETKIPLDAIDEVIIGNVLTAGVGQNPARQVAIFAGLPECTPAFTINQVCGSGLKAVIEGYRSILSGANQVVLAGGQENMSLSPHLLSKLRKGVKMGDATLVDSMIQDGLTDVYNNYHMGITAENIATQYHLSREELDTFALNSQQKASTAQQTGKFTREIVPIVVNPKTNEIFDTDEFIKPGIDITKLAGLRPAFKPDGVVTAGNSSGVNDGAAFVLLMSEEKAIQLNLPILAYINGETSVGLDPKIMGLGAAVATQKLLGKLNLSVDDIDIFELNEAFSAQAVAVNRILGVDGAKVNPNGGAIAIGHPIGASGCRILVTLIHELIDQNKNSGIAALCIGGGMGVALNISRDKLKLKGVLE